MGMHIATYSVVVETGRADWEAIMEEFGHVILSMGYRFKSWAACQFRVPWNKVVVFAAEFSPMWLGVSCVPRSNEDPGGKWEFLLYFERAPFAGFRGGWVRPGHLPEDEATKVCAGMQARGWSASLGR